MSKEEFEKFAAAVLVEAECGSSGDRIPAKEVVAALAYLTAQRLATQNAYRQARAIMRRGGIMTEDEKGPILHGLPIHYCWQHAERLLDEAIGVEKYGGG